MVGLVVLEAAVVGLILLLAALAVLETRHLFLLAREILAVMRPQPLTTVVVVVVAQVLLAVMVQQLQVGLVAMENLLVFLVHL
jgi:hypothetical protein